jgi:acyl-CoA thioester hydrolase
MYPGYLRKPHYYETDQMGIIHHSNYIRWFEEARVDLLEWLKLPYQVIEEAGIIIPVLAVSCTYKGMVRYGDKVKINVFVENYTGTRFEFRYELVNLTTNQVATTGTSSHCFLSKEHQRLISLKKKFPEFHEIFENYVNL